MEGVIFSVMFFITFPYYRLRNAHGMARVVNGQNAQRHAWPWQISLRYRGGHICGGSIISNWWILTASHCVEKDRSPRGYSVVVGN